MKVLAKIFAVILVLGLIGATAAWALGYDVETVIDLIMGEETEVKDDTYLVYYFEDGENSQRKEKSVTIDEFYTLPTPVNKTGYKFIGYYDSLEGGTMYVNSHGQSTNKHTIRGDIVLYGRWEPKSYTIKLDVLDGEINVSSLSFEYNETISKSFPVPQKEGYTFMGWFSEPNGLGKKYTEGKGELVEELSFNVKNFTLLGSETTIYAYYEINTYVIKFTMGVETNAKVIEIEVKHGDIIEDFFPTEMVNGQAVWSWSTRKSDPGLISLVEGEITQDLTLFPAQFAPVIVFDAGKGEEVEAIIDLAGADIELPKTVWPLNIFVGWFDDEGNEFVSTKMPSYNITLYAKFLPTIIFSNLKGNELDNIIDVLPGENITISIIECENFEFLGWFTVDDVKFEEDLMPEEGLELIAKWKGIPVTITFNSQGGTNVGPILTEYGQEINAPENPTKPNLVFAGWYMDKLLEEEFVFGIVDYYSLTLYAKWEEIYEEIRTAAELKGIFFNMAGNYRLMNDIELEGAWTPIGNINMPFTGILDGNGYAIIGMEISSTSQHTGFFVKNSGTIREIGFEAANNETTNLNPSSGIVAGLNTGIIFNVYVSGKVETALPGSYVTSEPSFTGGIVGYNEGVITNSYVNVKVFGSKSNSYANVKYLGGIAGYNTGRIENTISWFTYSGNVSNKIGTVTGGVSGTAKIINTYKIIENSELNSYGTLIDNEIAKTNKFLYEVLKWDSSIWEAKNGNYPTFKK